MSFVRKLMQLKIIMLKNKGNAQRQIRFFFSFVNTRIFCIFIYKYTCMNKGREDTSGRQNELRIKGGNTIEVEPK